MGGELKLLLPAGMLLLKPFCGMQRQHSYTVLQALKLRHRLFQNGILSTSSPLYKAFLLRYLLPLLPKYSTGMCPGRFM